MTQDEARIALAGHEVSLIQHANGAEILIGDKSIREPTWEQATQKALTFLAQPRPSKLSWREKREALRTVKPNTSLPGNE